MTPFQILALPVVAVFLARSLAAIVRGGAPRAGMALSAVVWLAAGVAIVDPDWTTEIARLLGIGRGADLVLYILAIACMIAFFVVYRKYRKLTSDITTLVRNIAIQEGLRMGGASVDATSLEARRASVDRSTDDA